MKAIIEAPIENATSMNVAWSFTLLLNEILKAKNENDLRKISIDSNFKMGFGNSHMWVKQVLFSELSERILIVEF